MALNAYVLTTRQRVKDFLGLSGSSNDSVIDRLINFATEFVENFCDRRFKQTAYTNEVYDGNGSDSLLLRNYPVVSGETFTLQQRDSLTNNDSWSTVDSELYFVKEDAGIVQFAKGGKFQKIPRHYRISYTAGFNFDNQGGGDTLETVGLGDLEYAVWKLIGRAFNQRRGSTNIERESLGDYSVGFRKEAMESPEIAGILRKHKRPAG